MTKDPAVPPEAANDLAAFFKRAPHERPSLGDLLGDPEWVATRREKPRPIEAAARGPATDHRAFLAGLAAVTGLYAGALIDEFERAGPLAVALGELFSLKQPPLKRRRGRPTDDRRIQAIHSVVTQLIDDGCSEKEAIKRAPETLFKLGIKGNGPESRPMHTRSVQEALKQYARLWFDPIDDTPGS